MEATTGAGADTGRGNGYGKWLFPVPVPPTSTALRWCWRKAPVARSRTRRLLFGDLGLQQIADDLRYGVLPFQSVGEYLVESSPHSGEFQLAHHLNDLS
jgi:hypothetical protein